MGTGSITQPVLGIGFVGMQERVSLIGGDMRVDSNTGHGTTVSVRVPADPGA
jgi:signal transduction histidine kinase